MSSCGFQEIQRPGCVDVEVVERNRGREIVGRLRRGMYDQIGFDLANDRLYGRTVSDIYFVVVKARDPGFESSLIPPSIPCRTEEHRPLVVVDPIDCEAVCSEIQANLGADETI